MRGCRCGGGCRLRSGDGPFGTGGRDAAKAGGGGYNAAMDGDYDVLVAGGGLVGATLAGALGQRAGLRVAVVDQSPPPPWPGGAYHARVSAVNRASQTVLENLGAWEAIAARRAHAFCAVAACAAGSGEVLFHAADIGETHLGHMVENNLIIRALTERAGDSVARITDSITKVHQDAAGVTAVTAKHGELRARVLAACDGPGSTVRAQCGFATSGGDYRQRCIVANVQFDGDHRRTAWQRFLPDGPLGILPLAAGHCSIAWSCADARAAEIAAMDDAGFTAALAEALAGRLGAITEVGPRLSFALSHLRAAHYVERRVVLVGDAAHVVHPLAGLGANLGIMDAAALATPLLEAHAAGRDPGAQLVLRRYERRRRAENAAVHAVLHTFNMVFTRDHLQSGTAGMVDAALNFANRVQPAKNLLMQLAAGLGGDLPGLARPVLRGG